MEHKLSKSYKCEKCGLNFKSMEDLEKHNRDVHGVDYLAQGIIRVMVEGPPGLGKKLLLEKITGFLSEEGFVVSKPKKHEKVGSWLIEIRKYDENK
jgi:SpoVK/Ycf46/Vps4 family AAA+-type ATPase